MTMTFEGITGSVWRSIIAIILLSQKVMAQKRIALSLPEGRRRFMYKVGSLL